jgi:hypothetical protein
MCRTEWVRSACSVFLMCGEVVLQKDGIKEVVFSC